MQAATNTCERFSGEIRKPSTDKREYRYITLSNKLKCLLVSDPETEKSAACVDVQVGSLSDPPNAQGLAHFLEHMLFMGTETYPEENAYSAYLSNHGGFSNAYTAEENTVYYFDVQNDFFEGALDLFASFFTCPLFTESSTMREINAVDSEHNKNVQSDSWRKFQLFKTLVRDLHPLHSFSTGNLETLSKIPESQGLNIRQLMIDFYQAYYSANVMCLSVYSNIALDQMEEWILSKFSSIPNKNLTRPIFPSDPFRTEQLCKMIEFVPVRDLKTLDIFFPMPATEHLYLTKPIRYLSHLIGHESDGSILSSLKAKHWANGLSAYLYQNANDFACFSVSIELSELGFQHIDEIIAYVFTYIGMIIQHGPKDWVYDELHDIAVMDFEFSDKMDPSDYVTNLSNYMQLYPPEHILIGDKIPLEKNLSQSMELLSYLSPINSIIFIGHKSYQEQTSLEEPWYHTKYNLKEMNTVKQINYWEDCLQQKNEIMLSTLHLPSPNPFIPTDFTFKGGKKQLTLEEERRIPPKLIHAIIHQRALPTTEATNETVGSENTAMEVVTEKQEEAEAKVEANDGDDESEEEEVGDDEDEDAYNKDEDDDEEESSPTTAGTGSAATEIPTPIYGKSLLTWHKQDEVTWCMPKASVYITLESHLATLSPLNIVLTDLLANVLKELMNEYSYYADCAGLYKVIQLSRQGITCMFQGYEHKLSTLITRTMEVLYQITQSDTVKAVEEDKEEKEEVLPICTEHIFALVKEKLIRSYKNQYYSQPYVQCMLGNYYCYEEPRFALTEKYLALQTIQYTTWKAYVTMFVTNLKVESLMVGNVTAQESVTLQTMIAKTLHIPSSDEVKKNQYSYCMDSARRGIDLFRTQGTPNGSKSGVEYVYYQVAQEYNPNEMNSAIENLYWIDIATNATQYHDLTAVSVTDELLTTEVMIHLMTQILSEPAFDQLRTKEQLGYMVFSGIRRIAQNILTIYIIIQSNHKDAHYLNHRIESFLHFVFRPLLASLTTNQLSDYITAVKEKLLEKPKNLDQECNVYWEEITNNTYLFERKFLLVEKLLSMSITTDSLLSFYDRYLSPQSHQRIKCSSQYYGKVAKVPSSFDLSDEGMVVSEVVIPPPAGGKKKVVVIQDANLFKRSMSLLPVLSCEPQP